MTEKITFISSSDEKYFPVLLEWIHSIRRFPQSQGMDICILDAGMTAEQLEVLEQLVQKIDAADWPKQIPAHKIKGREYYKACVNRPFFKDYFPGYDFYFWMDADTWVQDWRAIELFLEGARRKAMSITAQVDRAYEKGMRIKWLGNWPWKPRSFYFTNARLAFGMKTAKQLFPYHVLSAGAFCLKADAPHWEVWQELILKALDKGKVFTAEQLTIGIMIHLQGLPAEILPAYTHWHCNFHPTYDEERDLFVEPFLPHEPIGIMHLSGFDTMRIDRTEHIELKTVANRTLTKSLRYQMYNGEKQQEIEPIKKES